MSNRVSIAMVVTAGLMVSACGTDSPEEGMGDAGDTTASESVVETGEASVGMQDSAEDGGEAVEEESAEEALVDVEEPVEEESDSPVPTPESPAEPVGPETNGRGQIPKEFGERAGMAAPDGGDVWALDFAVKNISEAVCTEPYAEAPAEGNHLVRIDIEAETAPSFAESFEYGEPVVFFNFNWTGYDREGYKMNELSTIAAFNCLSGSETLSDGMGPAEKAVGSVVLEVTDSKGELAFDPFFMGGWVWDYDISE